jgi:mono/diheme cytochrome c family protein
MKIRARLGVLLGCALVVGASVARADEPSLTKEQALGKRIYLQDCVFCHGLKGQGKGMASALLDPKPRNFTDAAGMSKLPVETIVKAVTEGGDAVEASPVMPSFGQQLSAKQIRAVVAYLQTLAKP